MKIKTRALRLTAAFLSLALIHASFGLEAWAQVAPLAGMSAPVGGVGAAGASVTAGARTFSNVPGVSAAPVSLAPALTAAPSASLPVAAAAASSVSGISAAPASARASAATPAAAALSAAPAASTPEKGAAKPATAAAPAAAPASDEAPISAGPRTASVGARVARRFAELKAFLTGKKAESVGPAESAPAALNGATAEDAETPRLLPASKGEDAAKPAAPQPPAPAPKASDAAKRSINWFLGGMLVAQVGVEVLGLAMPLLMRQKFGGFSALAHIAVVSSAAGIVGRLSGGWIANKLGVKTTYIAATLLRLASITAMVVFLMGPTAPLVAAVHPLAAFAAYLGHFSAQAVLTGFYSFNGLMAGIALTAEKSIPTILLGNDRATMERFYSLQQWTLEIMGVSGPKVGGVLVQTFGFTTAIAVYPVMLAIAVGMYMFGIRLPNEDGTHDEAAPKGTSTFAKIMAPMAPMNRAIGGAIKRVLGKITGFVDSLVLKAYLGRWIAAKGGQGNLTDADEHEMLSRSTLGWTTAAILSLSAFLTLLLPTALPAYGAMVVFGVAEVIATQKLYSLILSRTKGKAEAVKVNAVAGAVFAAIYTGALNGAGTLFDHLAGRTPFLWFAGAMLPVAAAVWLIKRAIASHEAKGAPEPEKRPTSGFGLLFKDPMMRWAFLGYVLLGMTNPLLYQILSQAFGLLIVGGSATAASGVASWITSLYSFGGLLGALYMWRESTLISNAKKPAEPAPK